MAVDASGGALSGRRGETDVAGALVPVLLLRDVPAAPASTLRSPRSTSLTGRAPPLHRKGVRAALGRHSGPCPRATGPGHCCRQRMGQSCPFSAADCDIWRWELRQIVRSIAESVTGCRDWDATLPALQACAFDHSATDADAETGGPGGEGCGQHTGVESRLVCQHLC